MLFVVVAIVRLVSLLTLLSDSVNALILKSTDTSRLVQVQVQFEGMSMESFTVVSSVLTEEVGALINYSNEDLALVDIESTSADLNTVATIVSTFHLNLPTDVEDIEAEVTRVRLVLNIGIEIAATETEPAYTKTLKSLLISTGVGLSTEIIITTSAERDISPKYLENGAVTSATESHYVISRIVLRNATLESVTALFIWRLEAAIASLVNAPEVLLNDLTFIPVDLLSVNKVEVEFVIKLDAESEIHAVRRQQYHDMLIFGRYDDDDENFTNLTMAMGYSGIQDATSVFDSITVTTYPEGQGVKPEEFTLSVDAEVTNGIKTYFTIDGNNSSLTNETNECPVMSKLCTHFAFNVASDNGYWLESIETTTVDDEITSSSFTSSFSPEIDSGNTTVWTVYPVNQESSVIDVIFFLREKVTLSEVRLFAKVTLQSNSLQAESVVTLVSLDASKKLRFESRVISDKEVSLYLLIEDKLPALAPASCKECQAIICEEDLCQVAKNCVKLSEITSELALTGSSDLYDATSEFEQCSTETSWEGWLQFSKVAHCYSSNACPLSVYNDNAVFLQTEVLLYEIISTTISSDIAEMSLQFGGTEYAFELVENDGASAQQAITDALSNTATVNVSSSSSDDEKNWVIEISNFVGPVPVIISSDVGATVTLIKSDDKIGVAYKLSSYAKSLAGFEPTEIVEASCSECFTNAVSDSGCFGNQSCSDFYNCVLDDDMYSEVIALFNTSSVGTRVTWNDQLTKCKEERNWDDYVMDLFYNDVLCYSSNECPLTEFSSSSYGVNVQLKTEVQNQVIHIESTSIVKITNDVTGETSSDISVSSSEEEIANVLRSLFGISDLTVSQSVTEESKLLWTISYFNRFDPVPSISVEDVDTAVKLVVEAPTDEPLIFMEAIGYKEWYTPPPVADTVSSGV